MLKSISDILDSYCERLKETSVRKQIMITGALIVIFTLLSPFPLALARKLTLKVGDPAPSIVAHEWIKGKPIKEFKKGTPYVIEFGATWCGPCAAAIPDLTALAQKHRGKAEVISFFVMETNVPRGNEYADYVKHVQNYVTKKGEVMDYTVAMDGPDKIMEKNWINVLESSGVPKLFLVDREGYIAFINHGYSSYAMRKIDRYLEAMYSGEYNIEVLRNKSRKEKPVTQSVSSAPYNHEGLLYINNNGGNNPDVLFRSILTRYEGKARANSNNYVANWTWAEGSGSEYQMARIQEVGMPLQQLYYLAYADTLQNWIPRRKNLSGPFPDTLADPYNKYSYGKYWPEAIVEVSDKSPFADERFTVGNTYNYSLKVPMEKNTARFLQSRMRQDLDDYFGYDATVETRQMPCWLLKVYPQDKKRIMSDNPKDGYIATEISEKHWAYNNAEVRDIIRRLSKFYQKNGIPDDMYNAPFIDATGIDGLINYDIKMEELDHFRSRGGSFEGVRQYLQRIGFYLEKGKSPMKVVVIRDPKSDKSLPK